MSNVIVNSVNKRLDEWVSEDRLKLSKVFYPKKVTLSRPPSPIAGDVAPTLPLNPAVPMKRKKSLKRSYEEISKTEMSNVPLPVIFKV